jgi:hypothetical protein
MPSIRYVHPCTIAATVIHSCLVFHVPSRNRVAVLSFRNPIGSEWIRSQGCRGTQRRKNALMTLQEVILRRAGDAVGAGPG